MFVPSYLFQVAVVWPLVFIAQTNPVTDIIDPLKLLLRLTMPRAASGYGEVKTNIGARVALIEPPGPKLDFDFNKLSFSNFKETGIVRTIGAASSIRNTISVRIGRFLRFNNVIIKNVSQVYDTMFDYQGLPIRAAVTVNFETFFTPLADDIDTIYSSGISYTPSSDPDKLGTYAFQ